MLTEPEGESPTFTLPPLFPYTHPSMGGIQHMLHKVKSQNGYCNAAEAFVMMMGHEGRGVSPREGRRSFSEVAS